VADGLMSRAGASDTDQKPAEDQFTTTSDEPLPQWERDLLEHSLAPAEEVQESAITSEADADAEIAEAAPEVADPEIAVAETAGAETADPEIAAETAVAETAE
jgi:small subunit ribosomal protein S2